MSDAPFLSSATRQRAAGGDASPRGRSDVAVLADNIIRQRLRIGDPHDPAEVARGLRRLFPEDARRLDAEAAGLPGVPPAGPGPLLRPVEALATSAEMERATASVERDLLALAADHRLQGIAEELRGWSQAILGIISDGRAAATLALDPRARDRVFGARRQLGDYARMARMVGALTMSMGSSYRRLAMSLDGVAALLLVLAGETLAGQNLGSARFLPSVPASELQARRDAVLSGLRGLTGATDEAAAGDRWPWGLHALRELLRMLEGSGHLDLRALLDEGTLGRAMDELVERAARTDGAGLRALGATADLAVHRLHRLLNLVGNRVQPPAPALTFFLKALQLFLDAFSASRSGYRLLFVGRPPVALYGLNGIGGPDPGTHRLLALVPLRGQLAELADCYLGCDCCADDALCQILLDKVLYDTDRAIDLYVLGSDPDGAGEPEWRAAAYGGVADAFLAPRVLAGFTPPDNRPTDCATRNCFPRPAVPASGTLQGTLQAIRDTLWQQKLLSSGALDPLLPSEPPRGARITMGDELCLQSLADGRIESLVTTLAPSCLPAMEVIGALQALVNDALSRVQPGIVPGRGQQRCTEVEIVPPPPPAASLEPIYRLGQMFPP
jgi:hypothetical protein